MRLPHGAPSHDAFSDLFRALDPSALQTALLRMAQDWGDEARRSGALARWWRWTARLCGGRSRTPRSARRRLCCLPFAAESKLTLAQEAVDGKVQAPAAPALIPAMPRLLDMLDLRGKVATADAMHAQRATAAAVVARGGDCALAPKGNQETLHEDVKLYLDDPSRQEEFLWHRKAEKGHGRVEQRTAAVCHDIDWLLERHDWPGLQAIGKVTGEREFPDGSGSADTRYLILGAKLPAERFAHAARAGRSRTRTLRVRRLHWVLDVTMEEDAARNRKGNGAACLAVMRRLALNIARAHPAKISMRRKFIRAGLSFDFMLEMLRTVRRQE